MQLHFVAYFSGLWLKFSCNLFYVIVHWLHFGFTLAERDAATTAAHTHTVDCICISNGAAQGEQSAHLLCT